MKIKSVVSGLLVGVACSATSAFGAPQKSVLLLAGPPSHGPGEHEHNAGVLLFKKCLDANVPQVQTKVHLNGEWPTLAELSHADTIVLYSDGGGGNIGIQGDRLAQLDAQMKRGCGLVALHYAVEVPKDKGGPQFRDWLGGYFETDWSVNPFWTANFKTLPKHPITRGVQPFSTNDEWYFHMRFKDGMTGVTPLLSDVPPLETMNRGVGAHEGNAAVRAEVEAKLPQHVAWAVVRPDGGRGFGFTGGHLHKNWGLDDQRKLILNAILWTAKARVPRNGVPSKVTPEELAANLDKKG